MPKSNRNTQEVGELVCDALHMIPQPYPIDITFKVCNVIQASPLLFQRYEQLKSLLTVDVVNNWIGKYTSEVTGLKSNHVHVPVKGSIIKSYSELV